MNSIAHPFASRPRALRPRHLAASPPWAVVMLAIIGLFFAGIASPAKAQETAEQTAPEKALELFNGRISALESSVQDIRGQLEAQELAARQDQSGEDITEIRNQLKKLADELSSLNNRLERTLSAVSDNEFRLLRMEKRLESLMRLGIDQSLNNTAAGGSSDGGGSAGGGGGANGTPSATGAGTPPASSLNGNQDQSAIWAVPADDLENALGEGGVAPDATPDASSDASSGATASDASNPDASGAVSSEGAGAGELGADSPTQAVESVLPEVSPEDQYQFALGKALQNDLIIAERAFQEFTRTHDDHDRTADAFFWLGRVQFMRGAYEKSVMTLSNFQTQWPNDARVEKTTLWIGEAVSNFATGEDVCELLTSLPSFVPNPTESFFARLDKLKNEAACNG